MVFLAVGLGLDACGQDSKAWPAQARAKIKRGVQRANSEDTLWLCQNSYWKWPNDHRNTGFTHWKWWFSIAMLNYQRVSEEIWRYLKTPNKSSWMFNDWMFCWCAFCLAMQIDGFSKTPQAGVKLPATCQTFQTAFQSSHVLEMSSR